MCVWLRNVICTVPPARTARFAGSVLSSLPTAKTLTVTRIGAAARVLPAVAAVPTSAYARTAAKVRSFNGRIMQDHLPLVTIVTISPSDAAPGVIGPRTDARSGFPLIESAPEGANRGL